MRITPSRVLAGALAGSQVAYAYLPERLVERATRAIVGLGLATTLADAIEARGAVRGTGLVVSAGALGFAAEQVGTATDRPFGAYSYSGKLGPKLGDVPLLAAAAWAMMARPAWTVAGLIDERPARRAALAAGALTAWDVFLDPRMAREGYWSWPQGGRYEGIPATNFAGWLLTGAGVFALWAAVDADDQPAARGDVALGLYLWTWIGETYANAAIWKRPRVAAVGATAMGLFAVPALWARLRAR